MNAGPGRHPKQKARHCYNSDGRMAKLIRSNADMSLAELYETGKRDAQHGFNCDPWLYSVDIFDVDAYMNGYTGVWQ